MIGRKARHTMKAVAAGLLFSAVSATAQAAQCGNDASGFPAWVEQFRVEAQANGISPQTLDVSLGNVRYATKTISLDRNQKSFNLSLEQFMQRRGADQIVSQGRRLKEQNAALFASIESRYGVPPGVVISIWGMETAFGSFMGDQSAMSALSTLAYDCRRSEFFTRELYAALQIVQSGELTPDQMRGAGHGELGQTQFLPSNYVRFAVDADGDGRRDLIRSKPDALASTANFLRAYGWQPGAGYQPGQPNFGAIQAWNAAGVYQQAIAIIAARIDG
ncbi:lytic murein transglycosylase [Pararhizobium haloflavum]|uniref:lytic murein transglycosylase n=1 Tax=Pararhizobium haloflavum TaxID=2037914 RepID=UPI000C1A1100|nr:lytic murein transglycosylase [Pararhizobium haloflavum]